MRILQELGRERFRGFDSDYDELSASDRRSMIRANVLFPIDSYLGQIKEKGVLFLNIGEYHTSFKRSYDRLMDEQGTIQPVLYLPPGEPMICYSYENITPFRAMKEVVSLEMIVFFRKHDLEGLCELDREESKKLLTWSIRFGSKDSKLRRQYNVLLNTLLHATVASCFIYDIHCKKNGEYESARKNQLVKLLRSQF